MGKRRHGNWTETGSATRNSGASPKEDAREAMWEAYVRFDANKHQLTISMGGWGMIDQDIENWCYWFRSYLDKLPTGGRRSDELWAKEVNFAENHLTSKGVCCLLETLIAGKVFVLVLKLHHNQLTSGSSVAEFIHNSQGSLRELHLSHNELETDAAAEIVIAAAAARDLHGSFSYPSHAGHSAAPLWLRLEQNYVDHTLLSQQADPAIEKIRPGKVLCNVSSRACTPHCCVKHRHDPPPVHAKHLSNQRSKPTSEPGNVQDWLTMLRSGNSGEDREKTRDRQPSQPSQPPPKSIPAPEEEDKKEEKEKEGIFADVLRWDDDELKWVRDVIEIPELKPTATEESGRVKLSQEVGDKLGNQLKNLIGGAKRPDSRKPVVEPASPVRTTRSTPHGSPSSFLSDDLLDLDSTASGSRSGLQDDEHPNRSTASRRSRRGAQPLGSEVKQVNGLNPQAKEFIPMTGPPQKVHELNLQAFLNPEAEEFLPSDSQSSTHLSEAVAESAYSSSSRPVVVDFVGDWTRSEGGTATIEGDESNLVITNPNSGKMKIETSRFHGNDGVIRYDRFTGALQGNVIKWSDGSTWTKAYGPPGTLRAPKSAQADEAAPTTSPGMTVAALFAASVAAEATVPVAVVEGDEEEQPLSSARTEEENAAACIAEQPESAVEPEEDATGEAKDMEMGTDESEWSIGKALYSAFSLFGSSKK